MPILANLFTISILVCTTVEFFGRTRTGPSEAILRSHVRFGGYLVQPIW